MTWLFWNKLGSFELPNGSLLALQSGRIFERMKIWQVCESCHWWMVSSWAVCIDSVRIVFFDSLLRCSIFFYPAVEPKLALPIMPNLKTYVCFGLWVSSSVCFKFHVSYLFLEVFAVYLRKFSAWEMYNESRLFSRQLFTCTLLYHMVRVNSLWISSLWA